MELDLPFFDPEPIVEEEEPTVLEYARGQGICIDYTTDLPRLVQLQLSLKDAIDQDLRDPFEDELTNATTAAAELTKQRLTVTKDVALLLKSVLTLREPLTDGALITDGRQRILDMKQELPVLQTDAELDMLYFGTRIEPDFRDLRARLPSEHLDEENDEGFEWPAKYFAYPAQCDAKIKSEKLGVTRDVLMLLQSVMKDDFTLEDDEKIKVETLESRRDLVPRHLTPPLLPLSPPFTPYIPSSPANRLPLAPESSDSVTAEAKALEQQVMAQDSLARHHSGSSDSMLLDVGDLDAPFGRQEATSPRFSDRIPTILKRRADDLKVEGPLTPPILSDSPMKRLKSVSFSNMIQVGDSLEPWTDEHRPETSDSRSTTDELFKEIEPIANEAARKVENEKLTGADTISRVEVPHVEFTLPVAPWDQYGQRNGSKRQQGITELEAQMGFLAHVKNEDLKSATAWRGGIPDLHLTWGWFGSPTSTIKLSEKLHGETDFNKIQTELKTGNIATSSNEVWKKDGLRILDDQEEEEEEEEEEVEPAEFEERNGMEALIRKRKLEMEEQEESMEAQQRRKDVFTTQLASNSVDQPLQEVAGSHYWQGGTAISIDPYKNHQPPAKSCSQQPQVPIPRHEPTSPPKKAPTELMFGGFSASTALHKFMETQGKAIKSAKPTAQTNTAPAPPTQDLSHRDRQPSTESLLLPDTQVPHQIASHALLPLNLSPASYIVSSAFLQRRPLLKAISQLHPHADLLYREYTLPHFMCLEADIVLSPSTGLLLATLPHIKQVALPGQTARSGVKEWIASLQERYERLLVLVSEGLRDEGGYARPEDARDKEVLKGLEVFAGQCEGDVSVQYVRGGEQSLARAVVESMGVYGLPTHGEDMRDVKLFPVETTWEVFLRRAGLNPFAAQVILARLKHPTSVQLPPMSSSPTSYEPRRTVDVLGLPRLLLMSEDERIKRFQAIMGGSRILRNLSSLLDQQWLSAAHGFKM